MKMRRFLAILFFLPPFVYAQENIAIGTWRSHASYRDAQCVALTPTGAYCAGANSLFFLDLQDNSVNRLSKVNGLTRTNISAIHFDQTTSTLVIAYGDGTIDLLNNNEILALDAIANTPVLGSKEINHITSQNGICYLSTDFGVVVLDLLRQEIREAYTNIGSDGTSIQINYGAIRGDTLFLATTQGVIAGYLDASVNLLDFANWRRFDVTEGIPETNISTITTFDNRIWATIDLDGFYAYDGLSWQRLDYELADNVLALTANESEILATVTNQLVKVDINLQVTSTTDPLYPKPQMAIEDTRGLWVADSTNGLVTAASGSLVSIYPPGPFSDSLASSHNKNNTMIALPPGYDRFRTPLQSSLGINEFSTGSWTNFNSSNLINTSFFPPVKDIVDVTVNPFNGNYYFASYGAGILQWDELGNSQILDETTPGSTLINTSSGRNVRITGVISASDGTLWATNYGNPQPLHQYNPSDGNWAALATPFLAARFPLGLQQASNGDFWMRLDPSNGGGIWVINSESAQQKLLTNVINEGGLPSRVITDLAIDLEGQVWIGTDVGVVSYPFPFDILDRSEVNASTVFIDGRPLLRDELINTIAVDGGNRKWIGTNDGLWLFSELGDSVIYNFTEENSPLPSNVIRDVEVDKNSGEVFIITDLGMVSYRGTATTGSPRHQTVRVFPNPVTREFSGTVGISGLVNNAIVKIADVTGKLVKEIRAQGGTATWDIADNQGRRVSSGVYLIYSSNTDGSETYVGKIAVVN